MKLKYISLLTAAGLSLLVMGCHREAPTPPLKSTVTAKAEARTTALPEKTSELEEIQYHQDTPLTNLYVLDLYLGAETLRTELALSIKEISTGMMYRESLPEDAAMLFVYPIVTDVAFYMKNTKIPLSCAYADPEGVILEIYDLEPFNEESVPSKSNNIRYVLEVNQGWFERHGIKPGTLIVSEKGSLPELFPLNPQY